MLQKYNEQLFSEDPSFRNSIHLYDLLFVVSDKVPFALAALLPTPRGLSTPDIQLSYSSQGQPIVCFQKFVIDTGAAISSIPSSLVPDPLPLGMDVMGHSGLVRLHHTTFSIVIDEGVNSETSN
jgi:hypothetical protein